MLGINWILKSRACCAISYHKLLLRFRVRSTKLLKGMLSSCTDNKTAWILPTHFLIQNDRILLISVHFRACSLTHAFSLVLQLKPSSIVLFCRKPLLSIYTMYAHARYSILLQIIPANSFDVFTKDTTLSKPPALMTKLKFGNPVIFL